MMKFSAPAQRRRIVLLSIAVAAAIVVVLLLVSLFNKPVYPPFPSLSASAFSTKASSSCVDQSLIQQRNKLLQSPADIQGFKKGEIFGLFESVANCPWSTRVGRIGDGGKIICGVEYLKQHVKNCLVYSFGSGNDVSFEESLLSMTDCDIHIFDPTPSIIHPPSYFNFHQIGLSDSSKEIMMEWGSGSGMAPVDSLEGIMRKLGHQDRRLSILKVDIEGNEWYWLPAFLAQKKGLHLPFDQLLIEFHEPRMDQMKGAVVGLEQHNMFVFAREPNPYVPGSCSEYSFVSEQFLKQVEPRCKK